MKKIVSCFLLIAMLLSLWPNALAAEGNLTLFATDPADEDYYSRAVLDMESDGDTLYILVDGKIYTWKQGEEPQLLFENLITNRNYYESEREPYDPVISSLYIQDGVIKVFDTVTAAIHTLSKGENGEAVFTDTILLETEARVEEDGDMWLDFQFEDHALVGDTLYVTGYDFNAGGELDTFAWDVKTGEAKEVSLENVEALCRYKDGKILCATTDPNNMYDSETRTYLPWTLAVYDPATDTVEEVTKVSDIVYYNVYAMVYDESADTLYLGTQNKIYRMVNLANCELAAYHPVSYLWGEGKVMAAIGGQVALFDDHGLYLRTADPAHLPDATLSVYGYWDSNEHVAAMNAMGDIPVFFNDSSYYQSAQELGQALAGGENQLDVLSVSMGWLDFTRLMEKGYCYDLSGSEVISQYMDEIYPFLKDAVSMDGKIFAIPYAMNLSDWHYNKAAWEALGLELPETYPELFQMMTEWAQEENSENWEEYAFLTDEGAYKDQVIYKLISDYEQYMFAQGETLTLDNDIFRSLMQAYEAIDTENVEVYVDWSLVGDEIPDDLNELWMKESLAANYYSVSPYGNDGWYNMMLKMSAESEYVLPCDVQVLFINPRSQNLEAAVQYLEELIKAYQKNKSHMIEFSPNYNEPVLNSYYEDNLESMQKHLTELEDAIAKADPIDKPALQEEYESYKEYVDEYTVTGRYQISEEDIAAYRASMEYAVVRQPSVLSSGDEDSFYTLLSRYRDGQISLEQLIQEGGSRLRLMQLENQ